MSPLVDQDQRTLAATAVDRTVVVTAGAGTGKTSVLVDRVCAVVTDPTHAVPLRHVAAVTFTEKAAGELRDRVRARLSQDAAGAEPALAQRAQAALDDLDAAAIGTLHSFAQRILSEHPVEAGLPPVVAVLDEVASAVRRDRQWSDVRARLLNEPSLRGAVGVLRDCGVRMDPYERFPSASNVRGLYERLENDWDLIEDRLGAAAPSRVTVPDLTGLRDATADLLSLREECSDPADKLAQRIDQVADRATRLSAVGSPEDLVRALADWPKGGRIGKQGSWPDIQAVREQVATVKDLADGLRAGVVDAALRQVVAHLAGEVTAAAKQRQRDGRLYFHDLLVLTRRLVRSSREARVALQQQYRRLLLDEFQDTDPIQVEIAVRIAAGADGGAEDWHDCPVPAGALFVVGDPKQSIYRFRRADIRTFLNAYRHLGDAGTHCSLTTNFRSTPAVLDWVNATFGELLVEREDVQPAYEALAPRPEEDPVEDRAVGPGVVVLRPEAPADGPEANRLEARDVAGIVVRALTEGWTTDERHDAGSRRRRLTPADITVLLPSRTRLDDLDAAFVEAGVPHRLEATSLLYRSGEIRDLLLVAHALDDPTDELVLVEALRTPVLGCGDDDLWRWRAAGGRWTPYVDPPQDVPPDDPVADAMAFLRDIGRRRRMLAPSELLEEIVVRRRVLERLTEPGRYREGWRRVRLVLDGARAWSEAEHGSLREYLAWTRLQAEDEERISEPVLPETDQSAVRVMTIHAAKGLEFPMVVLAGMGGRPNLVPGPLVWTDGGVEVKPGRAAETLGWASASESEKEVLRAEDARLLYVACTRARSHLAVSLHTKARKSAPADPLLGTRAEILAHVSREAEHETWTSESVMRLPAAPPETVSPPDPWEDWVVGRDRLQALAAEPAAASATDIAHGAVPLPEGLDVAPGLAKQPRDLELPSWVKGRYGAAIGRAVHATLQTVDLVTGEGLADVAHGQALVEGVADREDAVVALARAGFDAPIVRRAAEREHHKETYVGTVLDGRVVEGYIDLLFREDDGSLVVVDYKTDASPSPDTLSAYRVQLAVYARALADAAGVSVSRCVLVFCREGGAVEHDVPVG